MRSFKLFGVRFTEFSEQIISFNDTIRRFDPEQKIYILDICNNKIFELTSILFARFENYKRSYGISGNACVTIYSEFDRCLFTTKFRSFMDNVFVSTDMKEIERKKYLGEILQ